MQIEAHFVSSCSEVRLDSFIPKFELINTFPLSEKFWVRIKRKISNLVLSSKGSLILSMSLLLFIAEVFRIMFLLGQIIPALSS